MLNGWIFPVGGVASGSPQEVFRRRSFRIEAPLSTIVIESMAVTVEGYKAVLVKVVRTALVTVIVTCSWTVTATGSRTSEQMQGAGQSQEPGPGQ